VAKSIADCGSPPASGGDPSSALLIVFVFDVVAIAVIIGEHLIIIVVVIIVVIIVDDVVGSHERHTGGDEAGLGAAGGSTLASPIVRFFQRLRDRRELGNVGQSIEMGLKLAPR
jgi:hypothetical protein